MKAKIYSFRWDDADPAGYDVNDALMAGQRDRVIDLIQNAKEVWYKADDVPGHDADATDQWDDPADMRMMIYEKPDPIPWLFTQRVPAGRGGVLTGVGGSSKTTVLYAMAVGACCGSLPWGWKVERTGKALLVLTEDTAADVHHTIFYLSQGLTDDEKAAVIQNLVIFPMAGKDTRLMIKTNQQTVVKSRLYAALKQKILDLGDVVFVGLDPALSLSEGDEMDQGQQRALGKMADDLGVNTGAAVMLVSHSTKGSLLTEEPQSHSSRGGGALTDAVRGEYVLRNMTTNEAAKANITDVEERHRHVQLVNTKGNKIPPAARVPVWLRRDEYGNLMEVEIVFDEKGTFTGTDKKIIATHIQMSLHSTVKLADWRTECVSRGLISGGNPDAQKKAMQRVLNKLIKMGMADKGIGQGIYNITDLGKATQ